MAPPPEQKPLNDPPTFKGSAYDLLKSAGELRDGFLVLGATLYFLGYVTWAFNSWQKGLGLLPALESQYFIAGVVPALVILASYALVRVGVSAVFRLQDWLKRHAENRRWLLLVYFLVVLAFGYLFYHSASREWPPLVTVSFVVLFMLAAIVTPSMIKSGVAHRVGRFADAVVLVIIVVTSGVVALIFYLAVIYPSLPQALGGVKPRAVCLDVSTDELSEETLAALVPTPEAGAAAKPPVEEKSGQKADQGGKTVAHSGEVELMFPGSDFILIGVGGKVYEIKKDAVHAVKPCR